MQMISLSHSYGQLAFHVVFVTKYRRKIFFCDALRKSAEDTLREVASKYIFKDFQWLKAKFRTGHLWSREKFCRTVGSVTADAIEHYIKESQEKHLFD